MRAALAFLAALAGCATGLSQSDHPLVGRIWDPDAGVFVSQEQLFERAAAARHVLLGETHDNPEHHRLQHVVLEALARGGPQRTLAMEQFDAEQQPALEAAQARGASAEALADAGRFDRKGWNWPFYRPLVEVALAHRWLLAAANLSRRDARAIVLDPARSGMPPPEPALRMALEKDMIEGHCGVRPEPKRLAGLIEAQRARDATMARSIQSRASVLIAGSGHVRKDRGVPLHLPGADVLAVGFLEVDRGKARPADYAAEASGFDYVWFTPRAEREDPCARFRHGARPVKPL